jgi:hypothetical protein
VIGIAWRSSVELRSRIWPNSEANSANGAPKPDEYSIVTPYHDAGFFSEIKATIKAHGVVLFALRCLRLASCLALVAITIIAFTQKEESEKAINSLVSFKEGRKKRRRRAQALRHEEWIEIIQCAFYVSANNASTTCLHHPTSDY